MIKNLIQKLAQKIDTLPRGEEKKEAIDDYLKLKLSNDSNVILTIKEKYKI